jgi:DnaK suppressor protein
VAQSPQTLKKLEEKLRQQQQQLLAHTMSAVEQGRETTVDDTQDAADQAVLSYQKEMLFRQGTHGATQLTLIRGALERLAEGTFGECIQCGATIGAKRLEALPWTPYCIECQEKIERGELVDPVRAA